MDSQKEPIDSPFVVRALRAGDFDDLVRIDAQWSGHRRPEYYRLRLKAALEETGVRISLAAEDEGRMVGFLLGTIYFGEYGQPEPVARLEAMGVERECGRKGVAHALWQQFALNVKAMRIDKVQTQVDWNNWSLLSFLNRIGFHPGPRLSLERRLDFEKDED